VSQDLFVVLDRYIDDLFAPQDAALREAVAEARAEGLPQIQVSAGQGKLLYLLAKLAGARRILEVGTLGGYSAICMARALPRGGRIVTLEYEPRHAEVARANLRIAGMLNRVDIRVGKALDTLPALHAEGHGPFDFIFIDADKENNPQYLNWALTLSRPGTVIVVDNVARHGAVIRTKSKEPDIRGTRRMLKMMANHPRLAATALQTVGVKGLDGFAIAVVTR